MRGKFKKDFALKKDKQYLLDVAAVGDYVDLKLNEDGTGTIIKIRERKNYISRKAPRIKGASFRGERLEQLLAANIDNLIIIGSVKKPAFNNKLLDRILVIAESSSVMPVIVINKIDLDKNKIDSWISLYESIGYRVIKTSVTQKRGFGELYETLTGKTSIVWGASGVGKSSLLNALFPGLNLRVGDISSYSNKGTHTTVTTSMIEVSGGTFVIDTPGIREIDPYGIKKEDLAHYFIDFNPYINDCRFNTCTHHHEPACAVIAAVENGYISCERYESYISILDTVEDDMIY